MHVHYAMVLSSSIVAQGTELSLNQAVYHVGFNGGGPVRPSRCLRASCLYSAAHDLPVSLAWLPLYDLLQKMSIAYSWVMGKLSSRLAVLLSEK